MVIQYKYYVLCTSTRFLYNSVQYDGLDGVWGIIILSSSTSRTCTWSLLGVLYDITLNSMLCSHVDRRSWLPFEYLSLYVSLSDQKIAS